MQLTREIAGFNINFIVIYVIACIMLVAYRAFIIGSGKDDFLLKTFEPSETLTFWSVTHFILYFILGYFYSGIEEMFFFTLIGIAFEVLEGIRGEVGSMFGPKNKYWIFNYLDVMSNSMGLIAGNYVAYLSGKITYNIK